MYILTGCSTHGIRKMSRARAAFESVVKGGTELAGITRHGDRRCPLDRIRARYVESAQRLSGVMLNITAEKMPPPRWNKVVERTARLRETAADLEAFSYSISHDMRTSLRAIHGYAAILWQGTRAGARAQPLSAMHRRCGATDGSTD